MPARGSVGHLSPRRAAQHNQGRLLCDLSRCTHAETLLASNAPSCLCAQRALPLGCRSQKYLRWDSQTVRSEQSAKQRPSQGWRPGPARKVRAPLQGVPDLPPREAQSSQMSARPPQTFPLQPTWSFPFPAMGPAPEGNTGAGLSAGYVRPGVGWADTSVPSLQILIAV